MTEIVLMIVAGLILFLFAIGNLSELLAKTLGDNAKTWIGRATGSIASSLLVGFAATAILGSSSASIIITIVMVNAGIMALRPALGIVLGANIGTTVSSQIIALDFGKFSPVFLLIGFALLMLSSSERIGNIGKSILYFGVLFFGLFTMETAVEPLQGSEHFHDWMLMTENPLLGSLAGAIVTLIIQSSSATVGMAIILTKKGLLSLGGGVAVMLGAELGTCSDTLLATIRGSRNALRTGVFHLGFNLVSILVGLLLFQPFLQLVDTISLNAPVERALANAHMLFNTLGVLLFVWTIPWAEKALLRFIPEKPETGG